MPISGVVISTRPDDVEAARTLLATCPGVEIHGTDDQGHIVAVLDTRTSEEMEKLMRTINASPLILHTGLTYLNMEDVLEVPMSEVLHARDGQGAD